jgi:hypothetical protein
MKKIFVFIVVFISVILLGYILYASVPKEYIVNLVKEAERIISTPPPLRSDENNPQSYLTKSGVIDFTNKERVKQGLAPLKENEKLNLSAKAKAEDLFLRQYFEHESPTGEKVSDLASEAGYRFIILGENLAMGNFKNDEDLVRAWMNSPGHRENILNPNYQEIGVSVIKGTFEGKSTWMAVQHFALPLDVCPQVEGSLKNQINSNERAIKRAKSIMEYNNLVRQNRLLIDEYNTQVNAYNNCLNNYINK